MNHSTDFEIWELEITGTRCAASKAESCLGAYAWMSVVFINSTGGSILVHIKVGMN